MKVLNLSFDLSVIYIKCNYFINGLGIKILIKKTFIQKQVKKSKIEKKTSLFLRRLIFHVVDIALKKHYSETFSMKCLQSSVAIRILLEQNNIKSREIMGAVCVSQVFDDESKLPSWNGFWGNDHHVFLTTEYNELVDLTMKYLHLHPMSKKNKQLPVPAVWWSDIDQWPTILKYLPENAKVNIMLPEEDNLDLENFKILVLKEYENTLESSTVNEILYEPILNGIDSLNKLYNEGNMWLKKSLIFQELNIPLPPWVEKKEAEQMRKYMEKNPYI